MAPPPEVPYALTTGLGPLSSITVGPDGHLLVTGERGAWSVDGEGHAEPLAAGPVRAVAAHPDRIYLLRDDTLEILGPTPTTIAVGPAHDVLAVASGAVWLLRDDRVDALDPRTGATRTVLDGVHEGRALALSTDGGVLLLGASTVSRLSEAGLVVLRGGLRDARAVGADADELLVVDDRGLVQVDDPPRVRSTWFPTTTDLVPALGPRFPPGGWYLVNTEGRVELFRPEALPGG